MIVLTTFDADDHVLRALRAGAAGFLLKDTPPPEILRAVRLVAAGEAMLSPTVTRRLIAHVADDGADVRPRRPRPRAARPPDRPRARGRRRDRPGQVERRDRGRAVHERRDSQGARLPPASRSSISTTASRSRCSPTTRAWPRFVLRVVLAGPRHALPEHSSQVSTSVLSRPEAVPRWCLRSASTLASYAALLPLVRSARLYRRERPKNDVVVSALDAARTSPASGAGSPEPRRAAQAVANLRPCHPNPHDERGAEGSDRLFDGDAADMREGGVDHWKISVVQSPPWRRTSWARAGPPGRSWRSRKKSGSSCMPPSGLQLMRNSQERSSG